MTPVPTNGWAMHQLMVLDKLEVQGDDIAKLRTELKEFRIVMAEDISSLKVKSGVWGFAAGLLPALGAIMFMLLKG
jgi:hypothetical protein